MSNIEIFGIPYLKKGGIHIKEENKGKFTASAKAAGQSVQEHAKSVLNNPNATPLQKKRANFARNAAKWKHQNGGKVTKFQTPAGGIQLRGADRTPSFIQKIKEWWNGYPTDYSDGMCALDSKGNPTNDCSKYSNDVLRTKGYKAVGDAWTRIPYSGAKVLYSGYDKNLPETFDQNTYWEYLNNAADRFASTVDTTKVKDYDIVGLTSTGSPSAERAYNEGKKHGRINTHTGHIRVGKDGTHYVVHNVHNNLYQHKLADLLGGNKIFSAVEIARPKK